MLVNTTEVIANELAVLIDADPLTDQLARRCNSHLDCLGTELIGSAVTLPLDLELRPIHEFFLLGAGLGHKLLVETLCGLTGLGYDLLGLLTALGEFAPLGLEEPLGLCTVLGGGIEDLLDPLLTCVGIPEDRREGELHQDTQEDQEDNDGPG